jgi:GNAT superfamily N-acetyltransferase
VAIRLANPDDIVRMHEIRTAVRENRLSSPDRIRHEDYAALLSASGRGWTFEQGGVLVGFGIADGTRRNIWALFVAPGFEGQGIGRALLETMTEWLFAQADAPVWLTTAPGTRAERFYRAAGWRETGRENGELRFERTATGTGERAG